VDLSQLGLSSFHRHLAIRSHRIFPLKMGGFMVAYWSLIGRLLVVYWWFIGGLIVV
jgi:hypothetical protein